MYLNTINYGSGAYGIEAASQRYFSKHATELTIAEAATLRAFPQSPTYNNLINYPENCTKRRNVVLDRSFSNGVITRKSTTPPRLSRLCSIRPNEPSTTGIEAYPYFTSYVRDQLTNANGKYAYSKDRLFKGGLKVYTTLDVSMQEAAEAAARKKEAGGRRQLRGRHGGDDPDNRFHQGARRRQGLRRLAGQHGHRHGKVRQAGRLVVQDVHPGGSYRAGHRSQTTTMLVAFEDPPGWEVANHTNYGTKSISRAFAVSSNTAFACASILSIGPDKVVDAAKRMGITSPLTATDRSRSALSR